MEPFLNARAIDFDNLREYGTLYPTRAQVVKRLAEVTERFGERSRAVMKKMGKSADKAAGAMVRLRQPVIARKHTYEGIFD